MAQTFLEPWRPRGRIAVDGGSLRPWLPGIATNLARGYRRASTWQAATLVPIRGICPMVMVEL